MDLKVEDLDLNTLDLPEDYDHDQLQELIEQYKGEQKCSMSLCNIIQTHLPTTTHTNLTTTTMPDTTDKFEKEIFACKYFTNELL